MPLALRRPVYVPPRPLGRALAAPLALVGAGIAGCVVVALSDPTALGSWLPACPTKALTGVCCPGCGGVRMVHSLLHGRLGDALHYNAVSLVFLVLFAWSTAAWAVSRVRARHVRSWIHWRWTPLLAGVVIGGWFVVRNIPALGLYV
ncbi:DUF2752 domain-containing protein [Actinokineospora spheciospongiae]|uniref:DUF2752 domain-containing protein n=1 Tax=Actinokineospora spheciospongiae TaxID=909613 RepID=UPI000D713C9C|nr:DUF2752 domain-containing protein [Actinokineospora spheciospongiae]PWW56074.1 uncharacterized protein DUF2752 [Actinokineospora spheciospongiae]